MIRQLDIGKLLFWAALAMLGLYASRCPALTGGSPANVTNVSQQPEEPIRIELNLVAGEVKEFKIKAKEPPAACARDPRVICSPAEEEGWWLVQVRYETDEAVETAEEKGEKP